ncbi:MAG: ATP-dependent helicase HrpB [Thermoanaerobaculia bacterium]
MRTLPSLPIDDALPQIVDGLRQKNALVLRAPAGAGKTTRVPPALVKAGLAEKGRIVMLEPRRLAARSAARRMADEQGWKLGEEVGYQIRFDRRHGPRTRILVVTEGILVQRLQHDPFLEDVALVVFDEFHERNLHSDLSLAMCRRVQREVRPDLRIAVMSATLEPQPIADYLGDAAVVESEGRQHPVDVRYLERPDPRSLPASVAAGVRRALAESPGDVLAFLPGVAEIRRTAKLLDDLDDRRGVRVLSLYGDLPAERQDEILRPSAGGRRKVVLATNVAETSITIDGVTAVVDGGLAKVMRFDAAVGLDRLETVRVSRASADQRAGRAGRQGPGLCLRLWSRHDDLSLADYETPEIRRVDLAAPALQLLAWGESDLSAFGWFEPPEPAALERGMETLEDLGATSGGKLTELGRTMARLPVHPRIARLLIAGHGAGQLRRTAIAAALLSERDVALRQPDRDGAAITAPSDLLDRLDAVESLERSGYGETALGPVHRGRARQVLRVGRQLTRLAERHLGTSSASEKPAAGDDDAKLLRALLPAYPDRLARRRAAGEPRAVMTGGRGVRLARHSVVRDADLFLCLELDRGRSGERSEALVHQASAIEADWIPEERLRTVDEAVFVPDSERVVGQRRTTYRDLVIAEVDCDPGPEEAERALVAAAVDNLGNALAVDDPEVVSFLARVRSLGDWMPELGLPVFDDDELRNLLPTLAAGKRSFAELRRMALLPVLRGTLDHRQLAALERQAPSHLTVPSGSRVRLHYEPGGPPVLAVRIQEMFGLDKTPAVGAGRVPVLLHLLAPNHRPQQVTGDLASFWRNAYPEIRKELRARYPRHAWPEDPLRAEPERRPRRSRK